MKGVGVESTHTKKEFMILPKVEGLLLHNNTYNDRVQEISLLHQKGQLNSFN